MCTHEHVRTYEVIVYLCSTVYSASSKPYKKLKECRSPSTRGEGEGEKKRKRRREGEEEEEGEKKKKQQVL